MLKEMGDTVWHLNRFFFTERYEMVIDRAVFGREGRVCFRESTLRQNINRQAVRQLFVIESFFELVKFHFIHPMYPPCRTRNTSFAGSNLVLPAQSALLSLFPIFRSNKRVRSLPKVPCIDRKYQFGLLPNRALLLV